MGQSPVLNYVQRVIFAGLALLGIVLLGTIGYAWTEGWSLAEGFYMVIITLSTVGYGEVRPLGPQGRLVTIVLIVVGIGVVFKLFQVILLAGVEGAMQNILRRKRVQRMIEKLQDHVIICGFGKVGEEVARELRSAKVPIVVIDDRPESIAQCDRLSIPCIQGDATEEEPLVEAGIGHAHGLVACVNTDAENVFIVLTAREMKKDLTILARAVDPNAEKKLLRAGAHHVISPTRLGGRRIAQTLLHPTLVDFIEIASKRGDMEELAIEELIVPRNCSSVGKTIEGLDVRRRFDVLILGTRDMEGKTDFNPPPSHEIVAGEHLLVIGERNGIDDLTHWLATE